jgi:hypothetical protein
MEVISMRKQICLTLIIAAFISYIAVNNTKVEAALKLVTTQPLSETDRDGYILFTYSLADGEKAVSSKNDPTITILNEKDGTKFIFKKHVLSCGTHMTGWIKKSVTGAITKYSGDFEVTKNSYEITVLNGEYSVELKTDRKKGFLVVNDRKIDINLF